MAILVASEDIMTSKRPQRPNWRTFITWKTSGMRKCMRDHSSMRLFCSGVPVSRRRPLLLKLSSSCHRWLLKFLMCCASSRMK